MYTDFFGFREKPFKLIPSPAYLFLSASHEEALAHLAYAVSQGEGFVELIGEVGTGKTTLCRVFLSNLDDQTEAAYIFNPKLNELQLLKAINDEFGIDASGDNAKDLIDTLNQFLLARAGAGKRAIVVIDEAQNLSEPVLEQLRLLSNLETTQRKLLHIILVGQPELHSLLRGHELRQLGQRIAVHCRLKPLSAEESDAYVRHRLRVGGNRNGMLFTPSALHSIHAFARGVPRLINMVCDRSLLNAYVRNQHQVTQAIVRTAVRELKSNQSVPFSTPAWLRSPMLWLAVGGMLAGILIGLYGFEFSGFSRHFPSPASVNKPLPEDLSPGNGAVVAHPGIIDQGSADGQATIALQDLPPAGQDLWRYLQGLDSRTSLISAVEMAVARWFPGFRMADGSLKVVDTSADGIEDFILGIAARNGLSVHTMEADPELILKLNVPAILSLQPEPDAEAKFLLLSGFQEQGFMLSMETNQWHQPVPWVWLRAMKIERVWLLWNNFFDINGVIPGPNDDQALIRLRNLLKSLGLPASNPSFDYDDQTRQQVMRIQRKHGILDDGIVGTLTKIVLYNEYGYLPVPHLVDGADGG